MFQGWHNTFKSWCLKVNAFKSNVSKVNALKISKSWWFQFGVFFSIYNNFEFTHDATYASMIMKQSHLYWFYVLVKVVENLRDYFLRSLQYSWSCKRWSVNLLKEKNHFRTFPSKSYTCQTWNKILRVWKYPYFRGIASLSHGCWRTGKGSQK